MTRNDIV